MSSDQATTESVVEPPVSPEPVAARGFGLSARWFYLIGLVVVFNIVAFILFPPFPKGGSAGDPCEYPVCFINGTLEFPAPNVVYDPDPATAPAPDQLITFHPSITSTILTEWIVMAVLIVVMILLTRGLTLRPRGGQNAFELAYESLQDFGMSLAGEPARRYIPLFAGFFVLILACNWSGLLPFVGRIEWLRAPTSDVNITIGLALVAFFFFEFEGFHRLGVGGYLGKFFPIGEFRHGIGAGIIGLFVGLVELMLEFVKPLTLSMRLFGNIYGGEVALGVLIALTISFVPVLLFALEFMLNFIQALIFSVLTLMFTVLAIESHHEEDQIVEDTPADAATAGLAAPAH